MSPLQQAYRLYSLTPRYKTYMKVASACSGKSTMKHYRLNQIFMAVLGALLLFFGARLSSTSPTRNMSRSSLAMVPGTEGIRAAR